MNKTFKDKSNFDRRKNVKADKVSASRSVPSIDRNINAKKTPLPVTKKSSSSNVPLKSTGSLVNAQRSVSKGLVSSQRPNQRGSDTQVSLKHKTSGNLINQKSRETPAARNGHSNAELNNLRTYNGHNKLPEEPEEQEYEDDFEVYESDFEDDLSEDSPLQNENEEEKSELDAEESQSTNQRNSLNMEDSFGDKVMTQASELTESCSESELEEDSVNQSEEDKASGDHLPSFSRNSQPTVKEESKIETKKWGSRKMFEFERSQTELVKVEKASRAKELRNMIRLDIYGVELFKLDADDYENYMSNFSNSSCKQSYSQTDHETNNEGAQTEDIGTVTKWTQKPPTWAILDKGTKDRKTLREEALGVGTIETGSGGYCDKAAVDTDEVDVRRNFEGLSKFMLKVSPLMLWVLESQKQSKLPKKGDASKSIQFEIGLKILQNMQMNVLACQGEYLACSNGPRYIQTETRDKKKCAKNIISVWSMKEPSMPLYFLRVWGIVKSLCVETNTQLVLSGNMDGSLNVWNLTEPSYYHSQHDGHTIRTPSATTGCLESGAHRAEIIGLKVLPEEISSVSVLSLDLEGTLITWGCLKSSEAVGNLATSLASHISPWSNIHMTVRHEISIGIVLEHSLRIACFSAWKDVETEAVNVYFGTENGYVCKLEHSIVSLNDENFDKENLLKFFGKNEDSVIKVTSLDISQKWNLLSVGYEDGVCKTFDLVSKKAILVLNCNRKILGLKWSSRRHSVLYIAVVDCVYIYDILVSDIGPWKTIKSSEIQEFSIYSSSYADFLVLLTKELVMTMLPEAIKPLTEKEEFKVTSFLKILLQNS